MLAVHPTQLYETALGVVMFGILWRLCGHRRRAVGPGRPGILAPAEGA